MEIKFTEFYLSEPCYTKLLVLSQNNPMLKRNVIMNAIEIVDTSEFQAIGCAKELMIFDNLYNFIISRKSVSRFTVRLPDTIINKIRELISRYRMKTYSDVLAIGVYLLWSDIPENQKTVQDVLKKMEIIRDWVREGL